MTTRLQNRLIIAGAATLAGLTELGIWIGTGQVRWVIGTSVLVLVVVLTLAACVGVSLSIKAGDDSPTGYLTMRLPVVGIPRPSSRLGLIAKGLGAYLLGHAAAVPVVVWVGCSVQYLDRSYLDPSWLRDGVLYGVAMGPIAGLMAVAVWLQGNRAKRWRPAVTERYASLVAETLTAKWQLLGMQMGPQGHYYTIDCLRGDGPAHRITVTDDQLHWQQQDGPATLTFGQAATVLPSRFDGRGTLYLEGPVTVTMPDTSNPPPLGTYYVPATQS
ncbi:MAG TPA: hypothetical protein VLF67_01025 [Candidatus Saccharimonas sp.]|nr:hypothetical protein [Candidatus Saccharimonas sp.]